MCAMCIDNMLTFVNFLHAVCVCVRAFVCACVCIVRATLPFPSTHQGVTFRVENGELVIARILHGGMIDQQGLLHVGDIIKEVNAKEVGDVPRVLQEMLKDASGSVVLKILPSYQEPHTPRQVRERTRGARAHTQTHTHTGEH